MEDLEDLVLTLVRLIKSQLKGLDVEEKDFVVERLIYMLIVCFQKR